MLKRLPLMVKMLLVTVLAASAIFAGLDSFQARRLRATLYGQLELRLQEQAREDRLRFHSYVNAHRQAVKLLASQRNFVEYLETPAWVGGDPGRIVFHREIPPWLPKPSVLRAFVTVPFAMLLDPEGRVREVFLNHPDPPPASLLKPSDLLRTLSHNQSIMTELDDAPFLVTSEMVETGGRLSAELMVASPLDEDFLIRSQGAVEEPRLVALLRGDPAKIVASSNQTALPAGAPAESAQGSYLLTGKSFFDLASSDLVMMFASFISTAEVDAVMRSILAEGRQGRALTALPLILVSALIVFWITLHIRTLSRGIEEFSSTVLGAEPGGAAAGDELHVIESRFRNLTDEVVAARETLRREAEEKLALQARAIVAERQEQELKLLQALKVSEENYHAIFDSANDAIFVFDADTGLILDANVKAGQLLGLPRQSIIGMHYSRMHPPAEAEQCLKIFQRAVQQASTISSDICVLRSDGTTMPVEISTSVIGRDGKRIALGIFRDITERRRAEAALEEEMNRAQRYLDIAEVIIVAIGTDEKVRLINRAGSRILGLEERQIVGRNMFENFIPERLRVEAHAIFRRLLSGESGAAESFEFPVLAKSREERMIAWHNALVRDEEGSVVALLSSGEDITERKHAEEQARSRFRQLTALHSIDMIINSSLDLHVTLKGFIGHVIAQMGVDAADVLLLDPFTQTLEFAEGSGFRTEGIRKSRLRLGEGIAGIAALEHRSIQIENLLDPASGFVRSGLLAGEGFLAYYAEPLVAKGQIKGVLEILHRSPLPLDEEQREFLHALASQAAIAIDNATLFDELQRSNIELTLAYDATLEGWAKALDLRNRETERHSERVTEMTLRLARAMGMGDRDLVQVRRGALLHDMGKIGIPDSILLKPAPLTDEERQIMQRHPDDAFEMLRKIAYLRPALDIPYAHHERWDGSGYPRGLKGEQIPLPARIFAAVDIWDALRTAERPYRTPMSDEELHTHLRSLAGTHLDPNVVEAFLKLEW